MDQIILTGLTAHGYHGVFPEERRTGQTFRVDCTLEVDLRAAGRSDALADTINYAELADLLIGILTGTPRDLLETVAADMVDAVLAADGRIAAVDLTVHKPDAPIAHHFADVAVRLRRTREDHHG